MDKGVGGDIKELKSCKDRVLRSYLAWELTWKGNPKDPLFGWKPVLCTFKEGSWFSICLSPSCCSQRCFSPSPLFMQLALTTSLMPRWLSGIDPAERPPIFLVYSSASSVFRPAFLHRYWWHKVVQARKELNHKQGRDRKGERLIYSTRWTDLLGIAREIPSHSKKCNKPRVKWWNFTTLLTCWPQ